MAYSSSEKAILKTIHYSDIFNFPLAKDELWDFLIQDNEVSKPSFEEALANLSKEISYKDGFYCLAGNEMNIKKRKRNLSEARKKLHLAKKAAKLLSYIPTISLIGLSGGVAIGNVEKADDRGLPLPGRHDRGALQPGCDSRRGIGVGCPHGPGQRSGARDG